VEHCNSCKARLFTSVAFCPFCATRTSLPAVAEESESRGSEALARRVETPVPAAAERVPARSPAGRPAATRIVEPEKAPRGIERVGKLTPDKTERQEPVLTASAKEGVSPLLAGSSFRSADVSAAMDSEAPPRKPRKRLRNAALAAIGVIAVVAFLNRGPDKETLQCNQVIEQGNTSVKAGDLNGALEHAKLANVACTGSLAQKASELETVIAEVQATQRECSKALRSVSIRLNEKRLDAADNAFSNLPPGCASLNAAQILKEQMERAKTAAKVVEQKARDALDANDFRAASTALTELYRLDHEHEALPELHTRADMFRTTQEASAAAELAATQAQAAQVQAAQANTSSAPVPQQLESAVANSQVSPIMRPVRAVTPPEQDSSALQTGAARQFLMDAEKALGENRFDVARTYIESARRMDPNNQRIDALMRIVAGREHQVLEEQTTLK
jgi:hypothetical protein